MISGLSPLKKTATAVNTTTTSIELARVVWMSAGKACVGLARLMIPASPDATTTIKA